MIPIRKLPKKLKMKTAVGFSVERRKITPRLITDIRIIRTIWRIQ